MPSARRIARLGQTLQSNAAWDKATAGSATVAESAGGLVITGDGTNAGNADRSFVTIPGRTYRLTFSGATNTTTLSIGSTKGGSDIRSAQSTALGSNSIAFIAARDVTWLRFARSAAGAASVTGIAVTLR